MSFVRKSQTIEQEESVTERDSIEDEEEESSEEEEETDEEEQADEEEDEDEEEDDEEEVEDEESEETSSDEEEEDDDEIDWSDDEVSLISKAESHGRYLLETESFTKIADLDLSDALSPKKIKPEKEYRAGGTKKAKQDYQNLCKELGVVPSSKFLQSLKSSVMDLAYMGLNQKAVVAICKTLMSNTRVHALILKGNDCGGEAGEALAELLRENQTISHLNIARTNILKSMKLLGQALKGNTWLEVLDVSRNDLTNKEIVSLGPIIRNGVLRELYLSRNYIMDEGLGQLAGPFFNNKTIEVLDLSYNRLLGEKDSLQFYNAATQNPRLRHLDLQGNSLHDPAAKSITKLLTAQLEYLNVSHNLLTSQSCAPLGSAFGASNTTSTFIAGPNRWNIGPLTQNYLVPMIEPLTGPKSNQSAEVLDLCYITPVHKQFLEKIPAVMKSHPDLKILHDQPFGLSEGIRPDPQSLIIRRAKVVCENFETPLSMLIDELRTEPKTLTPKKFKKFIKSCNLYKDKKMTKEFMLNFPTPNGQDVDCEAIIQAYDKEFPTVQRKLSEKEALGEGEDIIDGGVVISAQNMEQLLNW